MPANFGTTPTSTTTLGTNQFPVSGVFVPGTAAGTLTALQGGPSSTDGNGYTSAPVAVYSPDGNDVTLGAKADAKNSATDTTAVSVMSVLKQISFQAQNPASTPVTGTFWQATQPVSGTLTANIGTTNGLALDSSVNGLLLSQGSTTSGQKGGLILGAVTSSAPSYTTAQSSPLSLTLAGALRVDGSAVTQPVSGTFWQTTQPVSFTAQSATGNPVPASAVLVGGTDGTNLQPIATDSAGFVKTNINKISGNAISTGNGTSTGGGVQRVTIASDSTGQIVLAAGAALIGGVELVDSGGTNKASISAGGAVKVDGSAVTQPVSIASLPALPANQSVNIAQQGGVATAMAGSDGQTASNVPLEAVGLYNGSTEDRWQGKSGAGYVARNAQAAYTLASTTTSGSTQNSGDITVGPYTEIAIDINTTAQAGTSPTIQYFWERKGADGIYYVLWQSNVLSAATNTLSTSVGAGMAYNQSLGLTGRLRWVIGGSATPTFTHSLNVYGK